MRIKSPLLAVCLVLVSLGAHAHAHLKASTPAEGAVLAQAPPSISLVFSESARITALSLQKDQEPKQKLTPPSTSGSNITVDIPTLAAGSYTLSWRVMSTDDNHIMSGELHFKVGGGT
jgi:methionine-rich copper-binding protein CopC